LRERHELVVGKTSAMQEVYKIVGRVAPTDATALIQGETGTGKELIAKAIHYHSARTGPFVGVNCSAIPRELLESELFGYERGAFTGALERRIGKLETPAGGTLFLDEVADMPLDLQAKLLRVLQEREFTRIGGRDSIRLDARIIAATNQDLEMAVGEGRFREDLFFRLRVVPITVPPLRDRRADIPELVEFFVDKINRDLGTAIVGVADDAREALLRHSWPGNVRELENTILRAAVLARGRTLMLEDLALAGTATSRRDESTLTVEQVVLRQLRDYLREAAGSQPRDLHARIIAAVERPLIEFVLSETGGNQLRAAELLGLNRNTLRKKITELGVAVEPTQKTGSSGKTTR
jgi:two-component system nitrogen regulation response regulator GlnG